MPVLLGAAGFDETANEGVTFVVDLTERKQAEAEARESERRYRELQRRVRACEPRRDNGAAHGLDRP